MAQSNCDALSLNMISKLSVEEQDPKGHLDPPVAEHFLSSPWYTDIIFVLQNLQSPQGMDRTRSIFIKQKSSRFCILDGKLYWKEPGVVLSNMVDEKEEKRFIEEFHAG